MENLSDEDKQTKIVNLANDDKQTNKKMERADIVHEGSYP